MWCFAKNYKTDLRLDNQTVVITGGNSGIGELIVKDFYNRGARILMLCRNQITANKIMNKITEECNNPDKCGNIILKAIDLTDLSSVRKCANEILAEENKIDILINNAGILFDRKTLTSDGLQIHFGVNYLSHFLLTLLLLPKLVNSKRARILNISSIVNKMPFFGGRLYLNELVTKNFNKTQLTAYSQSKLAQIMFTKKLADKLKEENINNINVYSLHPGIINTNILQNVNNYTIRIKSVWDFILKWTLQTPEQGTATILYCALNPDLWDETGLYYSDCSQAEPSKTAQNTELIEELWNVSLKMVGLKDDIVSLSTCKQLM